MLYAHDKRIQYCDALRQLQRKTSCSTSLLRQATELISPFLQKDAVPRDVTMADKKFHEEAGAEVQQLFACDNSDCDNRDVWTSTNMPGTCPQCENLCATDPKSVVYYFPLKKKLQALMQTPAYAQMLKFESLRNTDRDYFTDVFDTPVWRKLFRGVDRRDRVGLLFCMDAFDGLKSHMPAEYCVLSLPPWERYKAKNMLLNLLLPTQFDVVI